MSEELFDIFDENNQPLGFTKPRKEVHASVQYWHRATQIWITNPRKEILCQLRSAFQDVNPNKWMSFFGGHLKSGQDYLVSAVQEIKEEIGLDIEPNQLIPLGVKKNEEHKHFSQVYILQWDSEVGSLRLDKNEIESIKWLSVDELQKEIDQGKYCNTIDDKVIEYINNEIN